MQGLAADAVPTRVRVKVMDRSTTAVAGVSGVLLRVARADGRQTRGRVRLTVDYRGFRHAYGADWATRLRFLAVPECALATPVPAGCLRTVLPSRNNTAAGTVSAIVELAALPSPATSLKAAERRVETVASQGVLVALDSGTSGGAGDYAATSLRSSSTWTAGGSSGDFSWSYPMRMPPALGGPAPQVALAYSSQSVDGRMAASNNQPSWIGEGFEYAPGFVERKYKPCRDDMTSGNNNTTATGDLCWVTDNATLSLEGRSTELIKGPDGKWHARTEDGSRVELKTGASNGDDNGEYWVVTTVHGVQYWFGLNRLPGWASGKPVTNSTQTTRVYGNHVGEPCRQATFTASGCTQAYRWNLDWVVDPHGNAMSLWWKKATNRYARENNASQPTDYDRDGYLERIDYGQRSNSGYNAAPMRVVFATADRCTSSCTIHDAAHWPDAPWDQECTGSPCWITSPTYWTTRRLSAVTTQLRSSGTTYSNVESWTLTHSFPDPGDGTRAGLWLDRISHTGHVGTTTTTPDITFAGVQMPNRVDPVDGDFAPAMNWWRIAQIHTESGASINVSYSPGDCVPDVRMPAAVHNNLLRCYPVRWTPEGFTDPVTDYFHKYVVTQVTESDQALPSEGQSTRVITSYEYVGDPAWHYTDDDGLIDAEDKTWSVWRGYGAVRVRSGDPGEQTLTETRYFRGMHGDKQPTGTRPVVLPAAGGAPAVNDEDVFAGMARESISYNGPGGLEVTGQVNEPWQSTETASRTLNGTTVYARFVNVARTWTRTALDAGRPARVASVGTTYDSLGMPTAVDDAGDVAVAGDERCALTTYVRNTTAWLMSSTSRTRTFTVDCTRAVGGGLTEADVLGDARTSYDNLAWGTPPTKGRVSRVETLMGWNPGTQTPSYRTDSTMAYDGNGRQTQQTDNRNNTTTTANTVTAGGQVSTVTTTTQQGWVTTTTAEPAWGTPTKIVDPNGRKTFLQYDGLGRLIKVWLPGRDKDLGATESIAYTYLIRNNAPTVVTTSTLNPAGAYVTSHALYDSLLRPRQTQTPEAGTLGGRIITETWYDSAGRANKTWGAYVTDGPPDTNLFLPIGENAIPAVNRTVFDGAGRATATIFLSMGSEKWRTTTDYGGDRTDVTPPQGGTATSAHTDTRGHPVRLWQYLGPTPTPTVAGSYDQTSYTYNGKDQLTRVTDPAGNRWDYTFDLLGRQIQIDDPDKGRTTMTYTSFGDLETVTDSRSRVVAYTYDALGRRTSVRDTSPTGPKRAEWIYDTPTPTSTTYGQQTKSIRYLGANAYSTEVVDFNADYTPTATTYTVPVSEIGLAGTYTYTYTYAANGAPASTTLPDIDGAGGLPSERLSTTYTTLGQPNQLKTNFGGIANNTYASSTVYTRYGEPTVYNLVTNGAQVVNQSRYYEEGTRRLNQVNTSRVTSPSGVAAIAYTYQPAGNLSKISDITTAAADHQCFTYDYLQRLTQAWTPTNGDCGPAPSTAGLGGPAKYWSTWTFDAVGNRLSETSYNPPGNNRLTTDYHYPASGTAQPHTLQTTTGAVIGGYTYDQAGNTLTRPGTVGPQTLIWDSDGHLDTVVDSTGSTSYVYDADGNRLVRRDPAGKTLYLPGQELRYTTSGGTKATTRYYAHGGMTIGVRTSAGLTWTISDHHGTASHDITAATQAVATRRSAPYGSIRGTTGTWPAPHDKGFVGGTADNTGLTHLGAREYDPAIGRFISVDPVMDLTNPQQIHGYTYANNNPTTLSDPGGLDPGGGQCVDEGRCASKPAAQQPIDPQPASVAGADKEIVEINQRARQQFIETFSRENCAALGINVGWCNQARTRVERGQDPYEAWVQFMCTDGQNTTCMKEFGLTSKCSNVCPYLVTDSTDALMAVAGALEFFGGKVPSLARLGARFANLNHMLGAAAAGAGNSLAGKFLRLGHNLLNEYCSFSGDTHVLMADGSTKRIDQITIGDVVLATDPLTGKRGARKVTRVWMHEDTVVDLEIDGEVLTATEDHPFWDAIDKEWQDAQSLIVGDELLSEKGDRPRFAGVIDGSERAITAYNLTVDDLHTYYVVTGTTSVLVHNSCQHILLGLDAAGVEDFAKKLGAETLMRDPDWRGTMYTAAELLKLDNPGIRVSFSLDNMAGVENGVEAAVGQSLLRNARQIGGATDLEIAMLNDAGVLGKIDFYIGGVKQTNPFG